MKSLKAILCAVVLIITLIFTSCTVTVIDENNNETEVTISDIYYNFSFDFLSETISDENTMVSPLSVMIALSMLTNGADGNTLTELENTLGCSTEILNAFFKEYIKNINNSNDMKIADSIWFKDETDFSPEDSFLNINNEYYQAEIFKSVFDDSTADEINKWVSNATDDMIKDILKKIPEDAIMYIINALALDLEWSSKYMEYNVGKEEFTDYKGNKNEVEMLSSTEYNYFEDKTCTGVRKYYNNGYSFVALLPNEGVDILEFASEFTTEKYKKLLENELSTKVDVITKIPKFKFEYSKELNNILINMGIVDAFDPTTADFSKLGSCKSGYNIFVNKVLHKTFIELNEDGTKAAAVTVIEMDKCTSAGPTVRQKKYVTLDRPFMFMINDKDDNPVFIGTYLYN